MKKSTKTLLTLTAGAIAGMYAFNKYIETKAEKLTALNSDDGHYYNWKEGKIFYTKAGEGAPILLIHDTQTGSSGDEWAKINKKLAKNHTIYTIDLLGCGRSDKPSLIYTNFMYVQLIKDFCKDVIKNKTSVIATNMSSAYVIMANNLYKEIFDQIILINPASLSIFEQVPDEVSKFKHYLMCTPILGTFIYNVLTSSANIDRVFTTKYYTNRNLVSENLKDSYYKSAHNHNGAGKYLYSSLLSHYININMNHAVDKLDRNIYIIGSINQDKVFDIVNDYHNKNSNFEIIRLSHAGFYPHMEIPEKMESLITKLIP